MVLGAHVVLCMAVFDFLKIILWHQKWGKLAKNVPNIGFSGNLVDNFFLKMVYNSILYYLLSFCTNPIFGKNLVLGVSAKMLLAN